MTLYEKLTLSVTHKLTKMFADAKTVFQQFDSEVAMTNVCIIENFTAWFFDRIFSFHCNYVQD